MTREEANQEISRQVAAAYAALELAEALATAHKLDFSFNPSYGMGGHFYGDVEDLKYYYRSEPGWVSSSQDC